jgi:hypothetical protein
VNFYAPEGLLSLQGNKGRVVLVLAFPHQKSIVAAAIFFRILPADGRAMFIDRATAFRFVEELAGGFKDVVFSMTQDVAAIARDVFRKFLFRLLEIEAEPFPQPDNVGFRHGNPVIVATIGRTLRTVIPKLWFFDMTIRLQDCKLFFCHSVRSRLVKSVRDSYLSSCSSLINLPRTKEKRFPRIAVGPMDGLGQVTIFWPEYADRYENLN